MLASLPPWPLRGQTAWAPGGTGSQGLGGEGRRREGRGAPHQPQPPPPPSLLPSALRGQGCGRDECQSARFFVSCVSRGVRHLCENDWHRRSEPDDPEARHVLPGPGNSRLVPTSTPVAVSQRRSRNAQSVQLWGREEGRGPRQKWAGLPASAAPPAVKMLLSP